MKPKISAATLLAAILPLSAPARAAEPTSSVSDVVARVQRKLLAGEKSSLALAPEIAAMDALWAK